MSIDSLRAACLRCLVVFPLAAGGAAAQTTQPAPPAVSADFRVARDLYLPGMPVTARFTLTNVAPEPIDVDLQTPLDASAGVGLPRGVILGTPDQPALRIRYEDQAPFEIRPPQLSAKAVEHPTILRINGHGTVGIEVDLRDLFPAALRYPGRYTLEWRPPGGVAPVATVTFRIDTRKDVILDTDAGKVRFALFYEEAPRNVENFIELVRGGFYNGKTIHRVISGFLLQGGSPTGDSRGVRPDGKTVVAEFHPHPFDVGTLALAHRRNDPDSASCQFLVTLARVPEMDEHYTAIGQASDVDSIRTLQKLAETPTAQSDRPVKALVIRSISLVEAGQLTAPPARTRDIEAGPTGSAKP